MPLPAPPPAAGPPGPSLPEAARTARAMAAASYSPHTVRNYKSALRRFDAWLAAEGGLPINDEVIAAYLGHLRGRGVAPQAGAAALAAVKLRAESAPGGLNPAGPATRRVMRGWRRLDAAERTPRQAPPLLDQDVAAIVRTAARPRRRDWNMETPEQAEARAREDLAITGLSYYGMMRRSEVCAVRASDVDVDEDGLALVRLRRSKTNQEGDPDIRTVKGRCARAVAELALLRMQERGPEALLLPYEAGTIGRRLRRAGEAAGLLKRLQGHSGRVGAATELTARGASTADVMIAGGWKTERMVARYAAPNRARRGAVARLL